MGRSGWKSPRAGMGTALGFARAPRTVHQYLGIPGNTAPSLVRRGKCWLFIHPQTLSLQVKPIFKKSLTLKEPKPQRMTDGKLRAALHQTEFERVLQCPRRVCSAAQLASQMGRTARIYPKVRSSLVLPALAPVRATAPVPI